MRYAAVSTALLSLCLTTATAQTVLTVASWKGGGSELAAFPALIAKFERENPGVKVQLQYAGRGDHETTMNTKIQAGDAPDVLMVDGKLMKVWSGAGVLADLTQEPWVASLRPELRTNIFVNNKLYMFPMELIGNGVFVNMDLLKKAGVARVPLTLAEYKKACPALKKIGATPMLLPAKDGWTPSLWTTVLGIDQALRTNPNFIADVRAQKATFSSNPAFAQALTSMRELADAGCFDPRLNLGVDPWSTGLDEFRAGRVGFLPQGAWNIQSFQQNKALNFQFAPFPALSGTRGAGTNFVGTSWAVSAKSANQALARKWVAFWARPENLKPFLVAEGASSTLRGGASGLPSLARLYGNAEAAGRVFISPDGYWSGTLLTAVGDSMSGYLLDVKQDPSITLKRWDAAASK